MEFLVKLLIRLLKKMSSSWENITRRLDLNKSSRDTTYDKEHLGGRNIKKIPYTFTIPSITINPITDLGLPLTFLDVGGILIAQFNYTAPKAFRVLETVVRPNRLDTVAANPVIPTIRFRVGTTVVRYQFSISASVGELQRRRLKLFCPLYRGEKIQPNFTIEYYLITFAEDISTVYAETQLTTSLLALPNNADELSVDIPCLETVKRNEIDVALPEALPTPYVASSYWLTN